MKSVSKFVASLLTIGLALTATRPSSAQFAYTQVASGVARPVFVTGAPGDFKRVFIVSKNGNIRILDTTAVPYTLQSAATPFLYISTLMPAPTSNDDERGLLGLAFHPQFQTNGKFYIYYTANPVGGLPDSATYYCTVAEYTVRDPGTLIVNPALNQADAASARIIMQIPHPQTNHNGGWIGFGPDGYLYMAVGDGGNQNDAGAGHTTSIGNGQDTGKPLGKIMRININVTTTPAQGAFVPGSIASYGIPADNPSIPIASGATTSRNEIWAFGVRNPFRDSFDRLTGDFWIGDVGQSSWEEVNFQPALNAGNAAQVGGRNYGWRCKEGLDSFNDNGHLCDTLVTVVPSAVYTHGQFVAAPPPQTITGMNGGCAIIGGYIYRGCVIPELAGKYVFGDYCGGQVWAAVFNAGAFVSAAAITSPALGSSLVSFGEDSYGEIYFCDQAGGRVYKYVTAQAGRPPFGNCDFNRSGTVTVGDLFSYLSAWFLGQANADFNGNPQSLAGVTVQDLFDFLKCYFRGCQN